MQIRFVDRSSECIVIPLEWILSLYFNSRWRSTLVFIHTLKCWWRRAMKSTCVFSWVCNLTSAQNAFMTEKKPQNWCRIISRFAMHRFIFPALQKKWVVTERWGVCIYVHHKRETLEAPSSVCHAVEKRTSRAASSCWTTAELMKFGTVWILSNTAFSRSLTPWRTTQRRERTETHRRFIDGCFTHVCSGLREG